MTDDTTSISGEMSDPQGTLGSWDLLDRIFEPVLTVRESDDLRKAAEKAGHQWEGWTP